MDDEDAIRANIKNLPSSFDLKECLSGKSKESIHYIIHRLQSEINNGIYELKEEWVRTYNLVSFLHWVIGETADAKTYNEKVLKMDKNNIIASTNIVWFYMELGDAYELHNANTLIEEIQQHEHFQLYRVKAEAEIAYYYTRLGLKHQETAETKFKEVLEKAKVEKVDNNSIMLWTFGLGLTLRRLSRLVSTRNETQARCRDSRTRDAIEVFHALVREKWDSTRLKAMAFVQLGELSYTIVKEKLAKTEYFPEPYSNWDEEKFYRTALDLCDEETYVLERYGKFLRYKKRYDASEKMLRKSVDVRPTSYAHHHLALTLKSKLHKEIGKNARLYNSSNSSPNSGNLPFGMNRRIHSAYMPHKRGRHVRNLFHENTNKYTEPQESGYHYVYGADAQYHTGRCYAQGWYEWMPSRNTYGQTFACGPNQNAALNFEEYIPCSPSWNNAPRYAYCRNEIQRPFKRQNQQSNIHNRGKKYNSSSKQNTIKHNHPACNMPSQYNNYDSGIGSLSSSLNHLSLKENIERDGSVKMKVCKTAETIARSEAVASSETKAENMNTEIATTGTTGNLLNDLKVKQTQVMVKSPKKPLPLPKDDTRTKEILYHLEQAMMYSDNRAALYDKGLTLRATDNLDEAIGIFKSLLKDETSLVYLANAYEQCAICMLHKSERLEDDVEEKEKLSYNMKDYFMKSIAISAKLVADIPDITKVWSSATSLKEILLKERDSKDSLKQLAVLSERLNNYKEAISYYEEIINLEESAIETPKLMLNIGTNQMKDSNFVAALTVFEIVRSHPQGKKHIDQNMYIKCLVEAGFQALLTETETQFGRNYLNYALKFTAESNEIQCDIASDRDNEEQEADDDTFDIFILCDDENKAIFDMSLCVWNSLKRDCCLNVTVNSMDVILGIPKLSGTLSLIDKCRYYVIVIGKQSTEDRLYQLCIEHIMLNKSRIVVVIENEDVTLPNIIHRLKERIPSLIYEASAISDSVRINWMKRLLLLLLGV